MPAATSPFDAGLARRGPCLCAVPVCAATCRVCVAHIVGAAVHGLCTASRARSDIGHATGGSRRRPPTATGRTNGDARGDQCTPCSYSTIHIVLSAELAARVRRIGLMGYERRRYALALLRT
ncbi:hypothetical protein EXIGLDRAFT_121805 [Exidia glandulosa HHB12029]|uniref:Uncharacterized protein n=1 Tax=Exidia glandulosa HHB12029 TaxID=1314781 RepID=A0A165GE75_EXIGL|nr:hypothetical protein EXIGLDRAFT_121805 [Exidia glandulosa HHB12029]